MRSLGVLLGQQWHWMYPVSPDVIRLKDKNPVQKAYASIPKHGSKRVHPGVVSVSICRTYCLCEEKKIIAPLSTTSLYYWWTKKIVPNRHPLSHIQELTDLIGGYSWLLRVHGTCLPSQPLQVVKPASSLTKKHKGNAWHSEGCSLFGQCPLLLLALWRACLGAAPCTPSPAGPQG